MTERRPGQWPVKQPVDTDAAARTGDDAVQYLRRATERARRELVLGSIRAHLEEQPSAASVHAAARRWTNDITTLADDVARHLRNTA